MKAFLLEGYGQIGMSFEEELQVEMSNLLERVNLTNEDITNLSSLNEDVILNEEKESILKEKLDNLKKDIEEHKQEAIKSKNIAKPFAWLGLALWLGAGLVLISGAAAAGVVAIMLMILSLISLIVSGNKHAKFEKYVLKLASARNKIATIKSRAKDKSTKAKIEVVEDRITEIMDKLEVVELPGAGIVTAN